MNKQATESSPYGEYNKAFYEAGYTTWQDVKRLYRDEAYNPDDYKEYMKTHPTAFNSADKYHYDMRDDYKR